MANELTIHGKTTATSLSLPKNTSDEEWIELGEALGKFERSKMWWVGDWLKHKYPEGYVDRGVYDELEEKTGLARQSMNQALYVSKSVDSCIRIQDLSWEHHHIVAPLPEAQQKKWLERAIKEKLTVRQLRQEIQKVKTPDLPAKKFAVVYADPPWRYEFSLTESREIENQYPTMSIEEMMEYKGVPEDKNCLLVMWATAPKLRDALQVLEAWNFRYVTHGVWDKERLGMGYWFRSVHEDLLIAVRGQVSPPEEKLRIPSILREKRDDEHSRKPDMIYDYIESWFPDQEYVELFGRPKVLRPGWTYVTDKGIISGQA